MLKFNLAGKDGMSRLSAEEIKHGVDSVLQCIDNSVSGYNKGSILSRFNAGEAVRPDSIFIDIYDKSYGYYRMTGTAVDVACAPLFDIWGFGFTTDSLPSPEKVAKVRAIGFSMVGIASVIIFSMWVRELRRIGIISD